MNKKITYSFEYEWYPTEKDLPAEDRALLQAARQALKTAYAPYSRFRVGAAVLLEDGRIITGSNQENAAYPMCLCAERVALAAVESEAPNTRVIAMAITVSNEKTSVQQPAAPCGACRQVISEKEQRQHAAMKIILQGETGPVLLLPSGRNLLPFPFGGELLS